MDDDDDEDEDEDDDDDDDDEDDEEKEDGGGGNYDELQDRSLPGPTSLLRKGYNDSCNPPWSVHQEHPS